MKPDLMIVAAGPARPTGPPKAKGGEQTVPVAALAMPDSDQQMAEPEPGDAVTYEVSGKVVRIENGQAIVRVEMVNGQAVGAKAAPEPEPANEEENPPNDFAGLQDEARRIGPLQRS